MQNNLLQDRTVVYEKVRKKNVTVYLHVVSVDHNLDDSIPDLLWIKLEIRDLAA